jgi:sarcosine oxidase subunit alpha
MEARLRHRQPDRRLAAMNLAGPKSRKVLAQLTDIDLSPAPSPTWRCASANRGGRPARMMRVGFVGEWGYEIHVPAEYGRDGVGHADGGRQAHGIRPFGVEAQRLLRLEKGHIIVSQDTDGLTTRSRSAWTGR